MHFLVKVIEIRGLAGKANTTSAYIQCPDVASYTDGGTVIFEISYVGGP